MALSKEHKHQLLQMDLPDDVEMIRRAKDFLLRSGLNPGEMALEMGIGDSSLGLYLQGRYGVNLYGPANTLNIRAKLKEFIDLHDLKNRVRLRGTHYPTADYARVRAAVWDAMLSGVPYTIDGAPGTQKTWSLLNVAKEINESGKGRAVYVYVRAGMTPMMFLKECCIRAELPSQGRIDGLIRKLQYFLASESTVLLVDEGNHMDFTTMEILRQLGDNPPYFGVVSAGSHEFARRLHDYRLGQLQSRNRETLVLNGPTHAEARDIIASRLGVQSEALADEIIADCMAQADRTVQRGERLVAEKYSYLSARKLFDAVEAVAPSAAQKVEAIA